MTSRRDIKKAARLYKSFRERAPNKVRKVTVSMPRALMSMGHVDFIGYTTTHADGRATAYKHTFAKGSKPLLAAGPGQNQLYFIGGRFRVTGRGIVDLDVNRREIDD